MKYLNLFLVFSLFIVIGCATVKMQAPKEAIKVDISMRLDVYQHVQSDIDAIEELVTGSEKSTKPQSMLNYLVRPAYAQALSPEVEEAALRRKSRYEKLTSLEGKGIVGETISGLATIRTSADDSVERLITDENNDRMIIYREIAKKNGTSVEEVQELYAKRLQEKASTGTPIEIGAGNWQIK